MSYSGTMAVFEELRTYFSPTEWNQLVHSDRIICLNIMKNHLLKLSIGLKSVPPEFMTGKQHEEWGLHPSDAHTETDHTIRPAKYGTEQEVPVGNHSICALCNQFYIEECEEHEPLAFMAGSHVAVEETHRANSNTLPHRFETSRTGVPDTRPGVFYREERELPSGRKEAVERDYSMKRNNYDGIDAKEETLSRREEKMYHLTFAGKKTQKTHASKKTKQTNKSFCQSEQPKTHQAVRGGEKPYPCKQCDKRFGRLSDLKRHRRIHTGERPFHCTQCVKSFSEMSHLKAHLRVHDGEKPFKCTQCVKSFSQLGGLSRHQRLHTGERPFHCAQCDKSFSETGHLKRHQRVHNGERPFHCNECERSFTQLGHLKAHLRIHTGEKPFHCTECDRSFSQLAGLGKHRLVHTGEKRSEKK